MTYCKLGDLAITVDAYHPENIGSIVRIIGSQGLIKWYGFKGLTLVWDVEVASEGGRLIYDFAGIKEVHSRGGIPDAYLRPITPLEKSEESEEAKELCHV